MKILMVNNRLKVYGGEGTYMTSLGDELIAQGHDVQYFGLKDPDGLHGNEFGIYAKTSKNPLKLIKNNYNKKQFANILDAFKPDIIHLNLVYFTLTPSILIEAKKRNIKVIQTIHDGKIVCPSYQLFIHNENKPCTLCVNGDFKNCLRHKCHKNSKIFSYIAYKEAEFNRKKGFYNLVDRFVFPSRFMRDLHVEFGVPLEKTQVLCNFSRITRRNAPRNKKEKYVLFFGRVTKIKGVELIAEAAKVLSDINFKIVGSGDMISVFDGIKNVELLGFKRGDDLISVISNATISVFPSIWLENCPMAIQESIFLGTPVVASNIGGIPDMIKDGYNGLLFEPFNCADFITKIRLIYNDEDLERAMSRNCLETKTVSCEEYAKKIIDIYKM